MRVGSGASFLSITLLAFGVMSVLGQKANPRPDKDGIYAGWNGVRVASLVHAVSAVLPDDPQLKGAKHVCALLVVVGADGVLKKVALANKVASPLDEAAINAVSESQFEPGSLHGNPVPTRFMVWVPFLGNGQPAIPMGGATLGKKPDAVKKVTPPVPTSTPEAEFSDEARRAHSGGTVVFQVLLDEDGSLRTAGLLAVAGKGLDQNAYAAVRKYKFKPATLEGIPVPFLMTIEVKFRM